ncbi:Na+/H+ antiporter NhaC [Dellaglioa sp. TMW 2.2533]|nr:Na+/H+ antiporter NhaC [Dellaglioa carnosa]MCZ2492824.1 Na+/H+ antiporter NhaC [Dellaglioa carnosa]
MEVHKMKEYKITFIEALGVLIVIFGILSYFIIGQKMTPHVPILLAFTVLMFYGKIKGVSWEEIHNGISEGVKPGIIPIIIFLLIGVLVASWIAAGTIPTIMVLGFKIISVKWFLPTVFVTCSIVGLTVGSSFTTISTIGIAFLGIGGIIGYDPAMTSGAIVSGAFLGNNISPLSDTTNLASGIGKVNLFDHIMNEFWTVIPAAIISLVGFVIIGTTPQESSLGKITEMSKILENHFWISPITLLPVLVLLIFAWKKIPAIPTLLTGSIIAIGLDIINNTHITAVEISNIVMNGYVANTGSKDIDNLLTRGGITSMLGSVSLIILALSLGGLLVKFKIVTTLINRLTKYVNNIGRLILVTAVSSVGINFLIGEQYLSIILPGETFKEAFERNDIDKKYLTRTLADAGAAVNSLVPWGVSGTFISGALKINAFDYLPYAFFPILCPIITVLLGYIIVKPKYKNFKS